MRNKPHFLSMGRKRYSLSNDEKLRFSGLLLLHHMIEEDLTFPILLEGNDLHLEPALQHLRKAEHVSIKEECYVVTDSGRSELEKLFDRFEEWEYMLYVYHSVDLEAGEFAMSSYNDFDSDSEWRSFLKDKRWEDLRMTVLEYRNEKLPERHRTSPAEFVFTSLMKEGRLKSSDTWQNRLLTGEIWQEIMEICNSALSWRDLGDEDVILDIVNQGSRLMADIQQD